MTSSMGNPVVLSGPSASNSQFTLQFLSSVLSQRGPSALPYSEDAKWLIRQHLLSLTSSYASLEPKTAVFIHNDGRSVNLLQADGTVPMTFQSVTYNIPVIIWLVDSYPRRPPTVYVNPTRDMIIKRPHPHVDPSGIVSCSYLQNWIYPSSNLVELVRNLSIVFSRDPPLYSQRRPNPTPAPSSNPSPLSLPTANHSVSSNLGSTAYDRPSIPPRPYPQSPYGVNSAAPGRLQSHTEEPNEVYKRNAITKLVENVHSDIVESRKAMEGEMDGLFSSQGALRQREKQINHGLKEMLDEKEGLEQQLQTTLMNTDVLEAWLRETKGKMGGLVNLKVDDAFNSVDLPSKQILECTASDLAVEDVIYSLDKAVQEGSIPFDQYLRNVRLLCREQFVHRATAAKVRTTQIQYQVDNMSSRISHYVS